MILINDHVASSIRSVQRKLVCNPVTQTCFVNPCSSQGKKQDVTHIYSVHRWSGENMVPSLGVLEIDGLLVSQGQAYKLLTGHLITGWSGSLFLIAPFPDLCLLVPFYLSRRSD